MLINIKRPIKLNTVFIWLLLLLSYLFILTIISNCFDNDLGWHLRFGKEFWTSTQFSYTDTYTYSYYGRPWINHEWGGDLLMWPTYEYLGYPILLMIFSVLPLLALILALKKISGHFDIKDAAIVLAMLWSGQQILNVRLHMFTPLFLVILWYYLERPTAKKMIIGWPIIFWLWSILHGSWILGFIMIGIYWTANLVNTLCRRFWPNRYDPALWTAKQIWQSIIGVVLSATIICLNPYGIKVWGEVLSYFTNSYYKLHTVEWLPAYYTPIFWPAIISAFVTLPVILILFQKKRITWPQLLMYLAFWYSAWQYKRNALLFLVVCAPLISIALTTLKTKILLNKISIDQFYNKTARLFIVIFSLTTLVLLIIFYTINIRFTRDLWHSPTIIEQNFMPLGETEWLKKNTVTHPVLIFNDFSWGGYLDWSLPQDLIFFDGRGTATWKTPDGQSFLKYYTDLNFGKNGLTEIEKMPVQFIMLAKFFYQTDSLIKISVLTGKHNASRSVGTPRRLAEDIKNSPSWQLVYEDNIGWLWKRNEVITK